MSLAMFAAPFEDNISSNNNIMQKKRHAAHSRTQKVYTKENFDTNKVNSVLNKIHGNEDDDEDDIFNPPLKAESAGVNKTEGLQNNHDVMFKTLGRNPQPNYEGSDNLDLNAYTKYNNPTKTNEDYYKQFVPPTTNNNMNNQDLLLQKINYMITLLEDQQDERTNNVTEEVVLYTFLGVFIIFIADTFVRAGKYVR